MPNVWQMDKSDGQMRPVGCAKSQSSQPLWIKDQDQARSDDWLKNGSAGK
jgi:hypothetical protein